MGLFWGLLTLAGVLVRGNWGGTGGCMLPLLEGTVSK